MQGFQPDRRTLTKDPFREPRPSTLGNAKGDPQALNRKSGSEDRDLHLMVGMVQYAIPSLGWHRVAVENGGIVTASFASGHTDVWGTHSMRSLQPGAQVAVAVQKGTYLATIVGQMPSRVTSPNDYYQQPTYCGSWTTYRASPDARFYVESPTDAGGTYGYQLHQSADQHQGDWGARGTLGSLVNMDALSCRISVDEATGITFGLLDQWALFSARDIQIQSDGLLLTSDRRAKLGRFALAGGQMKELEIVADEDTGKLKFNAIDVKWLPEESMSETEFYEQVQAAAESKGEWPLRTEMVDAEAYFGFVTTVLADYVLEMNFSGGSKTFLKRYAHYGASSWYSGTDIALVPKNFKAEKSEAFIKEADKLVTQETLESWQKAAIEFEPLLNFGTDTATQLHQLNKNPDSLEQLTPLKLSTAEDGDGLARMVKAYELGDSASFSGDADPDAEPGEAPGDLRNLFSQLKLANPGARKAMFNYDDNGNFILANEVGSGIACVGGKLYISALAVQIVSAKDIQLMARDLHLMANRDIVSTSNGNTRIFSERSVEILSGNSGSGAILLESRGAGAEFDFPNDPNLKTMNGVVIKSALAPIAIVGGDICVQAGDTDLGASGTLFLNNKSGDSVLASASRVVTHASTHVQSFGYRWQQPSQAITHYENQSLFPGSIYGQDLWSNGAIAAQSNIVTAYGEVGRTSEPQTILSGLQQFATQSKTSLQAWKESAREVDDRLAKGKSVLSAQTLRSMSASFGATDTEDKKWYGMHWPVIPPLATVFRVKESGSWKDFEPMQVDYRPDEGSTPTYSWPGGVAKDDVSVPSEDISTKAQTQNLLEKTPPSSSTRKISFGEAFKTYR